MGLHALTDGISNHHGYVSSHVQYDGIARGDGELRLYHISGNLSFTSSAYYLYDFG